MSFFGAHTPRPTRGRGPGSRAAPSYQTVIEARGWRHAIDAWQRGSVRGVR